MIYGEAAQAWAGSVALASDVLVADPSQAAAALAAGLRMRRGGRPFRVALLIPDERAEVAARLAAAIIAGVPTPEGRETALDALAQGTLVFEGRPLAQYRALEPDATTALGLLWWLAEGALARSRTEYARLVSVLGRRHERVEFVAGIDRLPSAPPLGGRNSVVVWAPERSAADCALIAYALESLHAPVDVVCSHGSIAGLRAGFHAARDAARILAGAACIIDAGWSDPASARALAELGRPLVVPSSSGAQEYLECAAVYDPWERRSILRAVSSALGAPPPRARAGEPHRPPAVPASRSGPLVSVIVPTYKRPALLANALASICAQHYSEREIIVVNDAGGPVADVVAAFPGAQLIDLPENRSRGGAINQGLARARGEYVALLDDDDEFLPDHLVRLVAALEHSRLDVAYADTLLVYRGEEGAIDGVSLGTFETVLPSDALVRFPLNGRFVPLLRRRAMEASGGLAEDMAPAEDFEFLLRLALAHPFVHVPVITAMVNEYAAVAHISKQRGAEYAARHREIYRRHPAGARPAVERARAAMLAALEQIGGLPQTLPAYRFAEPLVL